MKFRFDVLHRAGVKHQAAEALSRIITTGTDDKYINDEIPVLATQHHTHNKDMRSTCNCNDCDQQAALFEPHLVITAKADNVGLETVSNFIHAQSKDAFFDQMKQLDGAPNIYFNFDKKKFLVRQAHLHR